MVVRRWCAYVGERDGYARAITFLTIDKRSMKIVSVECIENEGGIYAYLIVVVVVDLIGTKSNNTALNTGLEAHSNSATTTAPQVEKRSIRLPTHTRTRTNDLPFSTTP